MNMTDGGGEAPRANNSASTVTASTSAAVAAAQSVVDSFLSLSRGRGFAMGVRSGGGPTEFLTTAEVEGYLNANKVLLAAQETAAAAAGAKTAAKEIKGETDPKDYKWNLPPHNWSLPVRPMIQEPDVTKGVSTYDVGGTSVNFHSMRRGRLWFFGGAEEISTYDEDGNVTDLGAKAGAASDPTKAKGGADATLIQADMKYGFQFLWNPSSVSSSVSRNMDITPSSADRMKSVVGAFPGQETVSFNIVIDRINDFACLKALPNPETLSTYYGTGYPGETEPFGTKIKNLMSQGTMADLEYLFRAINGGSENWRTLLKKPTANIGFLMPTLLGLVLGPSTTNNLSYVGWLTGLTMQHEMFTEEMIPLRTTVSINMECFAGSGIVSS
jgi:hypothetical protein